jgi:CubicO group peptidase (beta-lactamase class C family)
VVLLVVAGGTVVFHEAFGARQLVPASFPCFPDTLFDVASLTKAAVTSVLAMREVRRRRIALEAPVVELLPEFEGDDRRAGDGPPAAQPLFRAARAPAVLAAGGGGAVGAAGDLAAGGARAARVRAGTRAVYSDSGSSCSAGCWNG